MTSNKKTARIAGVLYLLIIISGIFAEFFVREGLKVPGDAAATAANIIASESLFRLGIAGDFLMIICDVALALVFYFLLKPVNQALSLMAAFFRLIQSAVLATGLLSLFLVLKLLSSDNYLDIIDPEQLDALALMFLNTHSTGYAVALVFFGINCFIVGYLVYKSGFLPKVLGILLIIAAIGYLTDSFARFLMTDYERYETTFNMIVFLPAFIGELAMALWLLIKGIKESTNI